MKTAKWTLLNPDTVELVLGSKHEKELFDEERINMMPFLRGNLKHTTFEISIKIVQQPQSKVSFTAEDKFKTMAEVNPILVDLRNSLGLELDY